MSPPSYKLEQDANSNLHHEPDIRLQAQRLSHESSTSNISPRLAMVRILGSALWIKIEIWHYTLLDIVPTYALGCDLRPGRMSRATVGQQSAFAVATAPKVPGLISGLEG